ncbi:MAG TPA: ParB/RepB/Spo0J family partition protein [Candidatus Desulfaltia sp.]|nr:ParB/RepB/Spo0J family partition protein [Candidatus Desulfaltia sp.]
MRHEEVPLRAIDFRDERFRTSRDTDLEGLIWSIKKAGLISPPVLCRRGRRYVLVTGWRRALACRALGFRKIPVLVTEETNELRLFLMALSENLTTRELGLAGKATFLHKLGRFGVTTKTLVREYMPRLGLPATADHLHWMFSLAGADQAVLDYVSEKSPSPAVVKALLRFPSADRRRLLPLLRPLGQNKQKQVLEDLWEIGRRDELPVRRLLRRKEFQRILGSSRLSILQKAEKIRQLLRKIRHPGLSEGEETFRSTLRKMRWPRDITVQPSPYFEEDNVTVSFRFRNREEFQAALDKLRDKANREELDDLFRGKG